MEDDDVQKRFKNGLKMTILNDVAHVEKDSGKRRKSYMCNLEAQEQALIIDWTPVDPSWGRARLQYGCMEENFGLLEAGEKFWRLGEAYSAERVEHRKRELEAVADDGPAGGAAGTHSLPAIENDFRRGPETSLDADPCAGRGPQDWLGADPCAQAPAGRGPQDWLGADPCAQAPAGSGDAPASSSTTRGKVSRCNKSHAEQGSVAPASPVRRWHKPHAQQNHRDRSRSPPLPQQEPVSGM